MPKTTKPSVDSYIVLRHVIVPNLQENGDQLQTPAYEKSFTVPLNIEKTGKLRMFIFAPEFLGEFLGQWKPENSSVELQQRRKKTYGEPLGWALVGRDPEAIERAYHAMVQEYISSKAEVTVEPRIVIEANRGSFGSNGIALEFYRYLHNTACDKKGANSTRYLPSHYEWSDDFKPKKKRYSGRDGGQNVPWDPVLWDRLNAAKQQLNDVAIKLDKMIHEGQLAQALLAGKGPLLLGKD